jgi:hypothetical protein
MIDRTALLLPRLRLTGKAYPDVLDDTLNHLRIGHVAGQLRKTIPQIKGEAGVELNELLFVIAARFSGRRPPTPADLRDLDKRIETLIEKTAGGVFKNRLQIVDLLIDMRFVLGSQADRRITTDDR